MRNLICISVMISLAFISCTQEDEILYSCDKEINEWVIVNKQSIQQMDRHDLLQMDKSTMRAAYRAFSKEQKIAFWISSVNDALELNWSNEEREHILKVKLFINSHTHFFDNRELTTDKLDELESFFYLWLVYAKENFGWTNDIGIAIAGTGYQLNNTKGVIEPGISDDLIVSDCECNDSALSDFCPVNSSCDGGVTCIKDSEGCGWLRKQKCNGMCGPK